jgi:hypothetical protein
MKLIPYGKIIAGNIIIACGNNIITELDVHLLHFNLHAFA